MLDQTVPLNTLCKVYPSVTFTSLPWNNKAKFHTQFRMPFLDILQTGKCCRPILMFCAHESPSLSAQRLPVEAWLVLMCLLWQRDAPCQHGIHLTINCPQQQTNIFFWTLDSPQLARTVTNSLSVECCKQNRKLFSVQWEYMRGIRYL